MQKNAKFIAGGGLAVFFCACFALGWKQSESELGGITRIGGSSVAEVKMDPPFTAAQPAVPQPAVPIEPTQAPATLGQAAADASSSALASSAKSASTANVASPALQMQPTETADSSEPQPLPVSVHLRRSREQASVEGEIRNGARTPLSLTLREVDTAQQFIAEAQIRLAWNDRKKFGIEDGLPLRSGDKLIVESASYQAGVFAVP